MEHSKNFIAPEASTGERASSPEPHAAGSALDWPEFATREEAAAFWQGVKRGIRDSGRDLSHPHLPADFALNLGRDGTEPPLTSGKPLDVWPQYCGEMPHAIPCELREVRLLRPASFGAGQAFFTGDDISEFDTPDRYLVAQRDRLTRS